MNKRQTKKANKLLSTLCEKGRIERDEINSIIEKEDVDFICNNLESNNLIKAFRTDQSGVILITKTDITCGGQSLLDEINRNNNPQNIPNTILERVWYSTKKSIIAIILMIAGGFLLYLLVEWYKTWSYV